MYDIVRVETRESAKILKMSKTALLLELLLVTRRACLLLGFLGSSPGSPTKPGSLTSPEHTNTPSKEASLCLKDQGGPFHVAAL